MEIYKEYEYIFFHHCSISADDQLDIIKCINDHNYEAFMHYYDKYQLDKQNNPQGWTYFPDYIYAWDGDDFEQISVFDRDNFGKITNAECECG